MRIALALACLAWSGLAPLAAQDPGPLDEGAGADGTVAEKAPPSAEPAEVDRLLDQWKRARRAKDAVAWLTVLEGMSGFANEDFVDPALSGLKYRASRVDKAAAKEEASALGDGSKERVETLVLQREAQVQAASAAVLGMHAEPKIGKALLAAFEKKGLVSDKPRAAAAIVYAMGRGGYRDAQDAVFSEYKRYRDKDVLKACVRYMGQVKVDDFGAVRALCEALAAPQPGNVDAAFNPPASYWEERWRKWQYVRRDVSWSLREITGQTFQPAESEGPGDSRRALEYVKEHQRELGLK